MRKNFSAILFLFSIGLFSVSECRSESIFDQYDRELMSVINYNVFTDRYDSALQLCDSIITANPEDPSGHFFRAYTLMAAMTEEHDDRYQEDFFRSLDTVEILVADIMDTCQIDCRAWCYWYRGNVWAYRSLWTARFGSAASAYKLASKARENYEASLRCDSGRFDNYAGLGAVHYWKSAKAGILRTTGLIKDEREKGIAELKIAAESSLFSRATARKTLITVLNDYGQYDSAINYAREMLALYPGGRSFLWGISWAYYCKKDYRNACAYLQVLRQQLAERPGNFYKLIECDVRIVRCYDQLKQRNEARVWAAAAITYIESAPENVRDQQKDNIKYLRKMAGQ